jgi:hypothetical protein
MKLVIASAILATLVGCSSNPLISRGDAPQMSTIQSQKLTSNFTRRGIKVELECRWYSLSCDSVEPSAIEVTAYATSFGNSESNRETAFHVAEMNAKAKLRRFIQEDITTSSVTTTISKNVEKANDQIKQRITGGEVNMTEEEANKDSNSSIRVNTNDVTRTVTEMVRMNASGILRGVQVIDEQIVDRQTVKVTIRWDKKSEAASKFFMKRFSN